MLVILWRPLSPSTHILAKPMIRNSHQATHIDWIQILPLCQLLPAWPCQNYSVSLCLSFSLQKNRENSSTYFRECLLQKLHAGQLGEYVDSFKGLNSNHLGMCISHITGFYDSLVLAFLLKWARKLTIIIPHHF